MGLLGPDATSIAVTAGDGNFTVTPYGPQGAYLIVLAAQPNANAGMSSGASQQPFGSVSRAPGGAALTVSYRDGSQCRIPAGAPSEQCHPKGIAPEGGSLGSAGPTSEVHVAYVPMASHLTTPLLADARTQDPSTQRTFEPAGGGEGRPGPALTFAFKAPLAAPNASTAYVVELRPREVAGCATPSLIVSQPTGQTIAAGQPVALTVPLESSCATSYTGRVFLARSSSIGGESGGEGPLYEAIAARFGGGPGRGPTSFPTVGRFQTSVP
jgi:hypothetical protein